MSVRSRPRAATSVATSVLTVPARNRASARSRWPCDMSPCSASGRHVAAMELLREPVGAALRPDEDEREAALALELLDQPVELAVGRDRDEGVLDLALLDDPRAAGPRSGTRRSCRRGRARRPRRRAWPRRASSGARAGSRRTIRSTCGLKPMSSIRSASSRTRHPDAVERDEPALDEILEAAGRRDQDVGAARALRLARDRRAAVDGRDAELLRAWPISSSSAGDLRRELAGRHEDERRRLAVGGLGALDDRQAEGEGLARAGRRLGQHVEAGERVREDERLDRERRGDAALLERTAQLRRSRRARGKTLETCCCSTPWFGVRDKPTRNARRRNEKLNLTGRPVAVRAHRVAVERSAERSFRSLRTSASRGPCRSVTVS